MAMIAGSIDVEAKIAVPPVSIWTALSTLPRNTILADDATYEGGVTLHGRMETEALVALEVLDGGIQPSPSGVLVIIGNAIVGSTVAVDDSIVWRDAVGPIVYKWYLNDVEVGTGPTYNIVAGSGGKNLDYTATATSAAGIVGTFHSLTAIVGA